MHLASIENATRTLMGQIVKEGEASPPNEFATVVRADSFDQSILAEDTRIVLDDEVAFAIFPDAPNTPIMTEDANPQGISDDSPGDRALPVEEAGPLVAEFIAPQVPRQINAAIPHTQDRTLVNQQFEKSRVAINQPANRTLAPQTSEGTLPQPGLEAGEFSSEPPRRAPDIAQTAGGADRLANGRAAPVTAYGTTSVASIPVPPSPIQGSPEKSGPDISDLELEAQVSSANGTSSLSRGPVERPMPAAALQTVAAGTDATLAQIRGQMAIVTLARDGTQTELRLDPAELGRVRISLEIIDGHVTAHLSPDRPEVLDLLRRYADSLTSDLLAQGFDSAQMTFGQGGDADQNPAFDSTLEDNAFDMVEIGLTPISDRLDMRL